MVNTCRRGGRWQLPTAAWETKDRKSTTSELQSRLHLVCRLLLEKKKYANSRGKRLPATAPARAWCLGDVAVRQAVRTPAISDSDLTSRNAGCGAHSRRALASA